MFTGKTQTWCDPVKKELKKYAVPPKCSLGQMAVCIPAYEAKTPSEAISFSLPLSWGLSSCLPDFTHHSQYPHWSLRILSFIPCRRFSCTRFWRYLAVPESALRWLRDPVGAYHTSWAAEGRRNNWGKKQSGQSQIVFYYHRGILSQRDSLFFAFPSAHFSIKTLYF